MNNSIESLARSFSGPHHALGGRGGGRGEPEGVVRQGDVRDHRRPRRGAARDRGEERLPHGEAHARTLLRLEDCSATRRS